MWIEDLPNGQFKYVERYKDPMTLKYKRVSVTLDKKNRKTENLAKAVLQEKIDNATKIVDIDVSNITFSQLIDKYLDYQKKNVKLSTYERNKGCCNTLKNIIGSDVLVHNLNSRYIRNNLQDSGKKNGTLNEYLKRLKALLRWAYKNDYIDNVAYLDKIEPFKDIPHKMKIQDKYLEQDEITVLLDSMEKSNCWLWVYLTRFLLLSGMRIGEVIALLKSDIDGDVIHVTKTYDTNNEIITPPKTPESIRDVFIQKELESLLKQMKIYNKLNKIDSVLLFSENGQYIDYDNYRMFLRRHSKKSIGRVVTPHALRHTHASLLMANGIDTDTISRRLGHANSKITREIYLHVMKQLKKRDNDAIKNIKIM